MDIKIFPGALSGEIEAITSKSAAHRALICAALCEDRTKVVIKDTSNDIESTISCLSAMGANIIAGREENYCLIKGISHGKNEPLINCGESGSTFRFLLPAAVHLCVRAQFKGEARLPERPVSHLLGALRSGGAEFSADRLPFSVSGALKSGEYSLPGNISSQFVSGLLFVLPLLDGDSVITLTSTLESAAYIDMTVNMLRRFGIEIDIDVNSYKIKGNQKYKSPEVIEVENDWSNAAFFLTAGAIGEPVALKGLDMDSAQGDRKIVDLLKQFGAKIEVKKDSVKISPNELHGIDIDVCEIPDLLPVLAVAGAFARGKTTLYNAARLRLKESDRLSSVYEMLNGLGARVEEKPDRLVITGGKKLRGGIVDSKADHRIPMSAAVCACFCGNETLIKGAEAVNKSYPRFFEDFTGLGGTARRLESDGDIKHGV